MPRNATRLVLVLALLVAPACGALSTGPAAGDGDAVLPSWNPGPTRDALLGFVERTTRPGSPEFVPPAERVAVFDNDGTLWGEQPAYFQAFYALDRVRELAPEHPEWQQREPYASALRGDLAGVLRADHAALAEFLVTAHAGQTDEAFRASVRTWLEEWRHPQTGRRATEMAYQPMLELLDLLRAHDYRVFIVSGGGIDFLRVFSEELYGIPPERVVGSTLDARFELREGVPVIVKEPKLVLLDDGPLKPVGIFRHIGRRPVLAGGNSDGDLQMLQYTTVPRGADDRSARLGLVVHHTDGEREVAYDRASHVGRLDVALDEAEARGWLVVDMARDWEVLYPPLER